MANNLSDVVKASFDAINRQSFGQHFNESLANLLQQHMVEMRTQYPDLSYSLNSAIEKGNTVAFHWTGSGTHASTGRHVSWSGTGVAHVLNGRVRKFKVAKAELARDIQLGTVPRVGFGELTGAWRTKLYGIVADVKVEQDEDGIWGNANVEGVGESKVEGKASGSSVEFSITLPSGEAAKFTGVVVDEDTLEGTIPGIDGAVTFSRL